MMERQQDAVLAEEPLPYPGLPRDWVEQALDAVLLFDPDNVHLCRPDRSLRTGWKRAGGSLIS